MDKLAKRLRERAEAFDYDGWVETASDYEKAADAIEELQATLCNWCAVCPEDKRDLSTCEIYESCRAKLPKEECA